MLTNNQFISDQQCKIVGYRYLNSYDKCFKPYSDRKLSWQQSRDKCIEDGGDLVIFYDKPEEFYFETWLLNLTCKCFITVSLSKMKITLLCNKSQNNIIYITMIYIKYIINLVRYLLNINIFEIQFNLLSLRLTLILYLSCK
jgi:hypothetical protein